MSVVQITKACSLSCTYCFDKVGQEEAKGKKDVTISPEVFDKYLSRMGEFFKGNPKEKNICISGGEPTLHPLFKKFVNKAIHSGFEIYLLSNFTFTTELATWLKQFFDQGKIATMVNVNSPYSSYAGMSKPLWIRTLMNLKILEGPKTRLSFNIFDPDENYEFMFEVLKKYPKLDKTIRLGVVNPIISDLRKDQTYVFDNNNIIPSKGESTWSFYKRLGKVTDILVKRLTNMGYSIYLDCGVGWCIFNNETISLIKNNGGVVHGCSLPNDEVSIGGKYSSCYTLHDYGNEDGALNLNNHSIKKSRWKFILKTEFFKEHYLILPKCMKCPLLEKGCPRFCVSNNIPYYEMLFKNGVLNPKEDKFYDKLNKDEKNFTQIEYMLSKDLLNEYEIKLNDLKYKEDIVKLNFINDCNFRYYMYQILFTFLKTGDRAQGLKGINKIMEQVTNNKITLKVLDFKLVKIIEILIKEYKKIKED